ncbi:MAG: NusG domain II-containing protein [Megasphaera sp.]|jgi:hypothetical protein|uniref:NusG domain II-containing protein n=1 Tax=Megasphaera sueciensis TaxID=349094 RepID=UPI003D062586|nr:NusG domain II-containing protein [Megasphaera sp.]MCI1823843.1 NusG domain II-containing protein [Megasphaera sp.]
MIKKWDIALIIILLCMSLLPEAIFVISGTTNSAKTIAVIQVDGKEYKTIPLSEHTGTDMFTIYTKHGYNTVTVRNQTIAITDADCPDQICVNEGFISKPGATTVCLPHKVMIEVRAVDSSEPDIIPAH